MKRYFLLLVMCYSSYASTLTLDSILNSTENSALHKAINDNAQARKYGSLSESITEPLSLFGSVSNLENRDGKNEDQYSVGLSKKLMLNNIQEDEEKILRLANQAKSLEEQILILQFKNDIKNLYHQYCLDKSSYENKRDSYSDFNELFKKKEKAYQVDEISKFDILQLGLEKEILLSMLQEASAQEKASKKQLLSFSGISEKEKEDVVISCTELVEIKPTIKNDNENFFYTKKAYEFYQESTQKQIHRYSNNLESFDLSVQYDKERNSDKYTIGVAIPLTFTNKKSEYKKVEAMNRKNANTNQFEYIMQQKNNEVIQITSELETKANKVNMLRDSLIQYENDLLPLIQKGYDYGNNSVVEFLLIKQRFRDLQQKYFYSQKEYYNLLFKLYTVIEKKDNK